MGHHLLPFSPEQYHGKHSSRPYFEGWYYKHACDKGVFVVIPGLFRGTDSSKDQAFIQLIVGFPPKSYFLSYPAGEFTCHPRYFELCIGGNCFSIHEINLSLPEIGLTANLRYSGHVPLRTTLLSPSIMGPFSYLPKMQCNHGILSLWHSVKGDVCFEGNTLKFDGADGYIEKDWGEEFPSSWIWMQCGSGKDALVCAIARIPVKNIRFNGLIAVLNAKGRQMRFATYNGGKVAGISRGDGCLTVELKKGKLRLCIIARSDSFGNLMAPSKEGMNRVIRESVNCIYDISVCRGTETMYSAHFENGGLEMLDEKQLLDSKKFKDAVFGP